MESGLYLMHIYHDADCPRLNGGECNCEPEVVPPEKVTKTNLDVVVEDIVRKARQGIN